MPYKRARSSPYSRYKPKGMRSYTRSYSKNFKSVGYAKDKVYPAAEVKFFDSNFPQTSIPAGPATLIDSTLVAEIINGTGPQERVGRKIKVIKVDYSASVFLNGASASPLSTEAVRFDIWLDKQSNGIAASPGVLYTALAGSPGTCQLPNLFNEKRFTRLFTKTHQFSPASSIGASSANVGYKFEGTVRMKNCVIEYDDTTGNITDLTSNNIFTCWSSDVGNCFTNAIFTRVHYTDA